MTLQQNHLISKIEARMEELGKSRSFAFNQGYLTHCFVDQKMVMVTFDDRKKSPLYFDDTKLATVLEEREMYK